MVKNLPAMQETWVRILGWEDPLVKGKATHSSVRSGESHRLYSPWDRKEWDTTEQLSLSLYPLAQRFFPQPCLVYLTSHQRQSSFLFQCFYVQHFLLFLLFLSVALQAPVSVGLGVGLQLVFPAPTAG